MVDPKQPPAPETRALDRLAGEIQRLRIEFQRFLAGDLPAPPDERRERIVKELRRLRSARLKTASERFRLGALEARLQSHVELFDRRLREREEGGRAWTEAAPASELDGRSGVVLGRDDTGAAIGALYREVAAQRQQPMPYDNFRAYIERQAERIRQKTGCGEILFKVAEIDGKAKITAKPFGVR